MADPGILLWRRESTVNGMLIYQLQAGNTQAANTTEALLSSFIFAESKSVRTSTVILATFNVLFALATAMSILYDCYWASKRGSSGIKALKYWMSAIHPAETFPLILSLGIAIQGLIFLTVQSTGLSSLFIDGCSATSQFVFPAMLLVPYIQVVFGVECALRAVRKKAFPSRSKSDVAICIVVIFLMLIATWLPTQLRLQTDHCFGSLAWFVTRHGRLGLILLAFCIGIVTMSALTVFCRLTHISLIDHRQRIAASRMVYYLVLAIVSLAFVIPWFVTLTMKHPTITTSMMATVVLNLSGLLTAMAHLFLRSNIAMTSFRPKGDPGWSLGKHEIRLFGKNELGFDRHMLLPVSGPQRPCSVGSRASLIDAEKDRPSIDSVHKSPLTKSPNEMDQVDVKPVELPENAPACSEPAISKPEILEPDIMKLSPIRCHKRNQSYSLFPLALRVSNTPENREMLSKSNWRGSGGRVRDTVASLVGKYARPRHTIGSDIATDDDILEPPPPLHFADGASSRHRRDSSIQSSATVQIGLRISNVVYDPDSADSNSRPTTQRPSSPRLRVDTKNLTIDLRSSPKPNLHFQTRPSPLQRKEVGSPSKDNTDANTKEERSPAIPKEVRDARMKTLPPIPRSSTISRISVAGATTTAGGSGSVVRSKTQQLSPTVYSPKSIPKPGIGGASLLSPPPRLIVTSPLQPPKKFDDKAETGSGSRPRGSKASWI